MSGFLDSCLINFSTFPPGLENNDKIKFLPSSFSTTLFREGLKNGGKWDLFRTRGGGGVGGGGGRRSHSWGDFFAAHKPFLCIKEAPKQILCSLPTSDMLDIASNSMLKSSVLSWVLQYLTQGNGDRHLKILFSLGPKHYKRTKMY